ncbi:MAG: sugar ABC transporter substrate-binding protein [Phototrophicales bacterium]|nr:MAG: sugar ABC transporter substrate-binding protein [Phototrophicales bacterium]
MNKRLFVIALITLLSLTLLTPVLAQDSGDITLRWRTRPDNQEEADVYQAISDAIDAEWDGVTLRYEAGGTETAGYQDTLITEIEAGTAPDVFWIPGTDIARFAEAGLILNLAEYAAADEDFSVEDFVEQPMFHLTFSQDGEPALWGLPRDVSSFAIYYNIDLFDQAGIDYPGGENWDWEAFREAAEEITALGGDIRGFGMNNWWANYGYWLNAAGSSFFTEDLRSCGLDNENTVVALEFLSSLYKDGLAVPYGEDAEGPFRAGNVGMFINGRWATPGMTQVDFNWNVAELPAGPAGQSNWVFWGAYVVNAKTEHPEEAWELLTRLTSPEVQGQVAALGANIPSRVSEEALEVFLNTFPELGLNNQAFLNGLSYGVPETPVWFGSWSDIDNAYFNGVAEVINGDLSPQEFADTICTEVDQFFEE